MSIILGVIGGGQLARMMVPAALALGVDLRVLAEDRGMSAHVVSVRYADPANLAAVLTFAKEVDVLTFEHEHVPQSVLRELVAAGVRVRPSPDALEFAQDKLRMRERLAELGIAMPAWARVVSAEELDAFIAAHGGRAVVKTARGGYDGKGVRFVVSSAEVSDWLDWPSNHGSAGGLLVEEMVDYRRELAQSVARRPSGEVRLWPIVESTQVGGVCVEAIAPAPEIDQALVDAAASTAVAIAEALDVTGVLAVELFETSDGRILVNELAMRPHNTGHWSIDGSVTSQFEQHVRAVLDLPLGSTEQRAPWSVMVNVLGGPPDGDLDTPAAMMMAAEPDAKLHLYGKLTRPGRKIGHVTVGGEDMSSVRSKARRAADFFGERQ